FVAVEPANRFTKSRMTLKHLMFRGNHVFSDVEWKDTGVRTGLFSERYALFPEDCWEYMVGDGVSFQLGAFRRIQFIFQTQGAGLTVPFSRGTYSLAGDTLTLCLVDAWSGNAPRVLDMKPDG